jgi:hypothetical protein
VCFHIPIQAPQLDRPHTLNRSELIQREQDAVERGLDPTFAFVTMACLISLKHESCVQKPVGLPQLLACDLGLKRQMTQRHKTLANVHSQGL